MKELRILIFLAIFGIYLYHTAPTLTGGDSGEFQGIGPSLGIAHSPGYPLYCLLGKIFDTLIPIGNHAYRMSIFSAFFGALTFLPFSYLSKSLLFLPVVFLLSPVVLKQSIVAEVFVLNTFIAVILFLLFLKYTQTRNAKFLYLFALVLGLGIGNHHTLFLTIPCFIIWGVALRGKILLKNLLTSFLFFLLGISIYFYLPLRSLAQPCYDWEDPENLSRFLFVITRGRYGMFQLAQGNPLEMNFDYLTEQLKFYISELSKNFTPLIFPLFFISTYMSFKRKEKILTPLFLLILFTGPLFLFITKTPAVSPATKSILERFLPLSYLFFIMLIGCGIRSGKIFYNSLLGLIILYLLITTKVNMRNEFTFYDYAKNILNTLTKNSILFSDRADEMEFCVAYLINVENKRKDIKFIDCNAGVTRSIYGKDYYRIWGNPRLKRRERVEKEIIANTTKSVYYATFLPQQVRIPKSPQGLLYEIKKKGFYNWEKIYRLRAPVFQNFRSLNLYRSHFTLLGDYFLNMKKPKLAEKMYRFAEACDKGEIGIIAYKYYKSGYLKIAEKKYKSAIKAFPYNDNFYLNLGVVYEKMDKLDEAIKMYKKAIEINSYNENAYYNLAATYWKKSRWKEVVKCFGEVLRINPKNEMARKYYEIALKKIKK